MHSAAEQHHKFDVELAAELDRGAIDGGLPGPPEGHTPVVFMGRA